jgi:hypothetical protein
MERPWKYINSYVSMVPVLSSSIKFRLAAAPFKRQHDHARLSTSPTDSYSRSSFPTSQWDSTSLWGRDGRIQKGGETSLVSNSAPVLENMLRAKLGMLSTRDRRRHSSRTETHNCIIESRHKPNKSELNFALRIRASLGWT